MMGCRWQEIGETRIALNVRWTSPLPHLTLGVFTANRNEYSQALNEANRLDLDYSWVLDRLHLVKIDDHLIHIVSSQESMLG